jgi:antitoxin (DNA-binding transcriptional repressor) of toxin-antitoxin stability system
MVSDHGTIRRMETIAISKFKATCLATLERVRTSGRPVRVTRFGRPVADIVPPAASARTSAWMGSMRGSLTIDGDIVAPSSEMAGWDVLK